MNYPKEIKWIHLLLLLLCFKTCPTEISVAQFLEAFASHCRRYHSKSTSRNTSHRLVSNKFGFPIMSWNERTNPFFFFCNLHDFSICTIFIAFIKCKRIRFFIAYFITILFITERSNGSAFSSLSTYSVLYFSLYSVKVILIGYDNSFTLLIQSKSGYPGWQKCPNEEC